MSETRRAVAQRPTGPAKSVKPRGRKHFGSKPAALSELTNCQDWHEVETFISSSIEDVQPPERQILSDLRVAIGMFCLRHNFERDSLQKRAIAYFGKSAITAFSIQEKSRLFNGFQFACAFVFGSDWRSHRDDLQTRYLLSELDKLALVPELLTGHSSALQSALAAGDASTFAGVAEKLRNAFPAVRGPKSPNRSSPVPLPVIDIRGEICRNWTNPDFPLWMMTDVAGKQALQYLTAGGFLEKRALQQRIRRMKLKRHPRHAVKSLRMHRDSRTGRLQFDSFEFPGYLVEAMGGVPTDHAYGETGAWVAGENNRRERRCDSE